MLVSATAALSPAVTVPLNGPAAGLPSADLASAASAATSAMVASATALRAAALACRSLAAASSGEVPGIGVCVCAAIVARPVVDVRSFACRSWICVDDGGDPLYEFDQGSAPCDRRLELSGRARQLVHDIGRWKRDRRQVSLCFKKPHRQSVTLLP